MFGSFNVVIDDKNYVFVVSPVRSRKDGTNAVLVEGMYLYRDLHVGLGTGADYIHAVLDSVNCKATSITKR